MKARGTPSLLCTMATEVSGDSTFHLRNHEYICSLDALGGTVAKYAGQNVHKRLVIEDTYQQRDYDIAMKRAFLGTDEDLLAGEHDDITSWIRILNSLIH
jgi:hypothetical protein